MKPTNFAVAVVLVNPRNKAEVLAVKRPADDDALPNVWGLPAVMVKGGELPQDAVKRLGVEKLSTEIKETTFLGIKTGERDTYHLILMDIQAELIGPEPSVAAASTTGTKYVDQQWVSDHSIFKDAAAKGSLCSQIFLESKGIEWRN